MATQLKESAWTRQNKHYSRLLDDSVGYFAYKLGFNKQIRVLDLGCGDGYALNVFKKNTLNAFGADIHFDKLNVAHRFGNTVVQCDMQNMPFLEGSFDAVFFSHSLEHSRNRSAVLTEVKRIMNPGGMLLIIVPIEEAQKNVAHCQTITNPGLIKNEITSAGFHVVQERRLKRLEDELWILALYPDAARLTLPFCVLDLDDFSPLYSRLDLLLELREYFPKFKISLFTVPNYHAAFSLDKHEAWCSQVRGLNFVELLPHGYTHEKGEFLKITALGARLKILKAEKMFQRVGLPIKKIFKAPHWQINRSTYSALAGLHYQIADHPEHLTPQELLCYQYNWSLNEPVPDLAVLKGHGHVENSCGNGLEECMANIRKLPRDTTFMTISEYMRYAYRFHSLCKDAKKRNG